jgi:hypothetical protein
MFVSLDPSCINCEVDMFGSVLPGLINLPPLVAAR